MINNISEDFSPKLGLKKSQDMDINEKKQSKEFFPKLGLKKAQDMDINMTKKQSK